MTEDPAKEQLRELLYRWRLSQQSTPIEKLRRKGWRHGGWRQSHVFGWSNDGYMAGTTGRTPYFCVEISNTDGWRYHLYHPWQTELIRSDLFATDLLAAMAGIEHAEMLMADPQWVAADCEAEAEFWAYREAEKLASDARSAIRWARELGYEDICDDVTAGRLSGWEAQLRVAGRQRANARP